MAKIHSLFSAAIFSLAGAAFLLPAASATTPNGKTEKPKKYSSRLIWADPTRQAASRDLASFDGGEEPAIYYLSFESSEDGADPLPTEKIDRERWDSENERLAGRRFDYLMKAYYANTREKSRSGKRHDACFVGTPEQIQKMFFGAGTYITNLRSDILLFPSTDEKVIGVQFAMYDERAGQEKILHFRLPHCYSSGKQAIIDSYNKEQRKPNSVKAAKAAAKKLEAMRVPANSSNVFAAEGFSMEEEVALPKNLPRFALRADYHHAEENYEESRDRPWKNVSIEKKTEALEFALQMQRYAYEGLMDQSKAADQNAIVPHPKGKEQRYWCHMPWLNQGKRGREVVHGLTMELDLQPSKIYPVAPPGADWGVAVFNAPGCQTMQKVFGSPIRFDNPKWENAPMPMGTVSVKFLFTTANFPAIEKAFKWKAHVSLPRQIQREIRDVRHIQMDIAVKDESIRGTSSQADHWIMLTYYYDESYESPLNMPGLPEGLKHMRPVGIQTDFEKPSADGDTWEHSFIFAGAQTNGHEDRLNGPADNPRSSCLSCHGTAGTGVGMAPGFMANSSWKDAKKLGKHLDFGQQFALAKQNFETRARIDPKVSSK